MKTRWILLLVLIAIVAGLAYWSAAQPDAVVEVVRPHVGTLRAYVEEQAVTELPHDYLIAMPIAGWLEPIELREGDRVTKDDVLARLDTDDLKDRVRQARKRIAVLETKIQETTDHRLEDNMLVEANATVKAVDETVLAATAKLSAAKAILDFARTEAERLRKLSETESATDREVRSAETELRRADAEYQSDRLELAALKTLAAVSYIGPKFITDYKDRKSFKLRSYESQLEEAKAELEIEERNLARTRLESPIDGIILQRHQTRRQYLQAGTPLLTVGRLDDMEVIAEVLTQRATRISPGDPVEIFGEAIGKNPISGSVSRVYPAGFKKISSLGVEQQRVNVAVKLAQRPPALGVGFRVHVRIFHDEAADCLILPRTATFRGKRGEWQAMVVSNGVTIVREIKVGLTNDDDVQIIEGLTANDAVLARPSSEITSGMRVETTTK